MIHARERPHTGGVIQLKRVELDRYGLKPPRVPPAPPHWHWRGAGTQEGPQGAAARG